ncbi:MAG TPA: hypothetical protein VI583_15725 [Cyclobacteriaceae bacterium]|nr:hypothetical protein [Cyclobacteriaceae bacterium]
MRFTTLAGILFCSCLCIKSSAQAKWEGGIRLPASEWEEIPQILLAGENGLVIYHRLPAVEKSETSNWEIEFYDRDLRRVWYTIISMDLYLSVTHQAWFVNDFYLLFEGTRNLKKVVRVFRMNIIDRSYDTYTIRSFTPSTILKFDILHGSIVLGGIERIKPSVVLYRFNDNRPVILQGLYSNKIDLIGIDVDNTNELVSVMTSFKNTAGKFCIGVRSYDRDGRSIENLVIEPPGDIQLMQGATKIINSQYRVTAGVFRSEKSSGAGGIYISKIDINGSQENKFHDFNTFLSDIPAGDTVGANAMDDNGGLLTRLSWHVSDVTQLDSNPVILLEGFEEHEQSSPGLNPRSNVFYYYKKGLAVVVDDNSSSVRSFEVDMEGLNLEEPQGNLFLIPTDTVTRIGYFNVTRIGLANLDTSVSQLTRYFISLPELSGPDQQNTIYQHHLSGFKPWFDNTFIYYGIRTDRDEKGESEKSFFLEKIVF